MLDEEGRSEEELSFDWALMPCQLPALSCLTLKRFRAACLSTLPAHVTPLHFANPSSPNRVHDECLAGNFTPPRFLQDGLKAGQELWAGPLQTVPRSGPPNEQERRAATAPSQRSRAVEEEAAGAGLALNALEKMWGMSAWRWSRVYSLLTTWEHGLESEEEEYWPLVQPSFRDAEQCANPVCFAHSKLILLRVSTSQDAQLLVVNLGYLVQVGAQLIQLESRDTRRLKVQ